MNTATVIRTARRAKRMTQFDLACAAGVSPATVYRVEAGKQRPAGDTARALAQALGLRVNDDIFSHAPEADTASTGCGQTRDTDSLPGSAVSPIHEGA